MPFGEESVNINDDMCNSLVVNGKTTTVPYQVTNTQFGSGKVKESH